MTNQKLLSREQVWEVLDFSDDIWRDLDMLKKNGLYTPDILNQNLVRLTEKAKVPTYESILKALSEAVSNTDTLQSFSQYMEYFDTMYDKVATYKANMLAFDLDFEPRTAKGKDFKSKEYKEDVNRINKFLFNFDYKRLFRDIVKNLMRNGVYYCWFRKSGERENVQKYGIQVLPQDYCKITGYWQSGLLFDIDLSFLLNATVDLKLYDDIFGEYYQNLFNTENTNEYVPSNQFNRRYGTWSYWTQTSPAKGAWVFKYDTSTFGTVPPLASLMKNTVLDAEVQKLQYDKDFAEAYGILVGEIKMKKDAKQTNDFAIEPKLLGTLLSKVQQGLNNNVRVGAMPVDDTKYFQYEDNNPEMLTTHNQNTASIGASASRILYATDRVSEAELIAQLTNDYETMKPLYYQFNNFLNYFANKVTRKYKFEFMFDGSTHWYDKEARTEKIMELADRGIILSENAFAQAFGYPPHIFHQMIEAGKYSDFTDKLGQLMSIHTAAGTVGDKGGRPRKKIVATSSRDYDKRKRSSKV